MATFTIDAENNIVTHAGPGPEPTKRNRFRRQRSWPNSLRNALRPVWLTPGTASRAWRPSTT
jgi:hypothetical protein